MIINHENYNKVRIRHDISLLKTATPIMWSEHVKPIAISNSYSDTPTWTVASGWGQLSKPGPDPQHLQYIRLRTIWTRDCFSMYRGARIYRESICTLTGQGVGMCLGDSGGPLVANNMLIGITSWTVSCAQGYPDVFTRVSEYNGWIRAIVNYF